MFINSKSYAARAFVVIYTVVRTPLFVRVGFPYLRAACSVRGELIQRQAGEPDRSQMVNNVSLVRDGDCLHQRLRAEDAQQHGRGGTDTASV